MSAWISGIISVSERVGGGREAVHVCEGGGGGGGGGGQEGEKERGGACLVFSVDFPCDNVLPGMC